MPAGHGVQPRADEEQHGLVALDLGHLERRGHAVGGQFAPVAPQARGTGHPQHRLQVAQAAGRFLAIGLQRVGRVFVFVVALAHLQRLGDEKVFRVHLGVVALLKGTEQRRAAADAAGFEQRGLHSDVGRGFGQALGDRAHAGADLQACVPATADERFDRRARGAAGPGRGAVGQQHQHVHVGMGKQLRPAIAAHGHQRQIVRHAGALPQLAKQAVGQGGELVEKGADAARVGARGLQRSEQRGLVLAVRVAQGVQVGHGRRRKWLALVGQHRLQVTPAEARTVRPATARPAARRPRSGLGGGHEARQGGDPADRVSTS